MSTFERGDIWWYEFWFAGRRIRESSKSTSRTVARKAEQQRRRELESGFNNVTDLRQERIRAVGDLADDFLRQYKLRLPQSAVFAEYALNHVKRLLGAKMLVDLTEAGVIGYQNDRLDEQAAPKSVNEEVGFLLRIMGEPGDVLRARLRKKKMLKLKVRRTVGKAYSIEEKDRMLEEARKARSPHIFPALTLALNAGMRDAEIKNLTWDQINFAKKFLAVGRSKTDAGEGRTIPLNSSLFEVLRNYAEWYREKFGEIRPEWFLFPFGKPVPSDPTRPVTTLKTAWNNVRTNAKVQGRWHDNRHTLITDLAESGAGDQTIMDIAGHVSKQMLKHYSHIRMEAKRTALESIVKKQIPNEESGEKSDGANGYPQKASQGEQDGRKSSIRKPVIKKMEGAVVANSIEGDCSELPTKNQGFEMVYPQKSPQSLVSEGHRGVVKARKYKKTIGSSGRTRTYNPSVNRALIKPGARVFSTE
jgi:integrase